MHRYYVESKNEEVKRRRHYILFWHSSSSKVLPIWEGTSNVLSLDVLRALRKSNGECLSAFRSFVSSVATLGRSARDKRVRKSAEIVGACADRLTKLVVSDPEKLELRGRDLAFSLAQVYAGALLVEQCCTPKGSPSDGDVRTLWQWTVERDLAPFVTRAERGAYDADGNATAAFVYDGYDEENLRRDEA